MVGNPLGIAIDSRGSDKPATSLSWYEAAQFINWLNTSNSVSRRRTSCPAPGDVGYGATSNIELWPSGDPGYNPNNLFRNSQAHYFLPSVDEWYKAAYFDPSGGVYYDYPTGSNSAPTAVASGTASGTAVYVRIATNSKALRTSRSLVD